MSQKLTTDKVVVGDSFRFSVELLKQIDQLPDRSTQLVRLVEVRVEADGSKTLLLNNLSPVAIDLEDGR
jgi:gamma-glutamylcyclotransferase (GGCT)/AIG2-like uncharacterized protein YtfP